MEEKKRYIFKKQYNCSLGNIAEGREITLFRGILYIDGIMIPEPYATDIRRLFNDEKFMKEYIKIENAIKNKV